MSCIRRSWGANVFTARDAWVLSRLQTGSADEADLSMASAGFQPVARRIYSAAPSERPAIVEDWLRSCPDTAAIEHAVSASKLKISAAIEDDERRVSDEQTGWFEGIEPRPGKWLWRDRIPMGGLTGIAGEPKVGKGFLTLSIAAAVTRGTALPGGDVPDGPGSVLLMSGEDDPSTMICPRLRSMGADLSRIYLLKGMVTSRSDFKQSVVGPARRWKYSPPVPRLPTLRPRDLKVIEKTVADLGDCRLMIVNPIYAYQGGDGRRPAALRTVLTSLDAMAHRLGIAIIGVTYLTHEPDLARGRYRVLGSTTYQRICQSLYMLVRDRKYLGRCRVLMVDQSWDVPFRQPELAFVIDNSGDGPVLEWGCGYRPVLRCAADVALEIEKAARLTPISASVAQ